MDRRANDHRPTDGARIIVIGAGGGGSNAVDRMITAGLGGISLVAVNTDAQALQHSLAPTQIHLGAQITRGLGAGGNPLLGQQAADESRETLEAAVHGADLVFITAGMGGGTGTGAATVIAEVAQEAGALTIGVVTRPFAFEGARRATVAAQGIAALRPAVDTLIIIPNDRLLQVATRATSMLDAFTLADEMLLHGIQGIADLITLPGLINLDFADVRAIMAQSGSALMAIGRGTGRTRMVEAATMAITSPLLEQSIRGATGMLFNVTGGADLGIQEISEAAQLITDAADAEANIIFGAAIDPAMDDAVRLTLIATGFDAQRQPSNKIVRGPPPAFPAQRPPGSRDPPAGPELGDDEVPPFLRPRRP